MRASLEHRAILRSFSALVLVLSTAAAVLVVTGSLLYLTEVRAGRRIDEFHLRTLVLLGEVKARILRLEHHLVRAMEPGSVPELMPTVTSIGQTLRSVEALQQEFGGEPFRQTLGRAVDRYNRILTALVVPGWDASRYEEELAALGFTIHQLERLHAILLEENLAEISSARGRRARWSALGAGILILLTAAFVARLFVLVRERLEEQRATERALRKSREQLLQAQKLEALGTLVGGIAHDFNNILTAILGNAEALLFGLDSEDPTVPGLRQIQKAGERAAGITRQLLLFSRGEVGEPKVVDLGLLVRDLVPLLRRFIREDIAFEIELEDFLGHVLVEPVQIEQVLINLTVNARDAMPNGGRLTIRVCTREVDGDEAVELGLEPGKHAQLSVTDTGTGMSEEVRSRIFEPFFTTKAPGKGTGLGLSTAHGIVAHSGGQILLQTELGKGTRFDVYLPCRDEGVVAPLPRPDEPRGGREIILLVEDEELVRSVAEAALRQAGYEVLAASEAAEAERLCRDRDDPIGLILTDVVMPGVRGPELVERIRAIRPGVPVVYMSGYSEQDVLASVEASGDRFLPKPFRSQVLLEVVRDALDGALTR